MHAQRPSNNLAETSFILRSFLAYSDAIFDSDGASQ